MHNPLPHNRIYEYIDQFVNNELYTISDHIIVLGQSAKEVLVKDQNVSTPISVIKHPSFKEFYGNKHDKIQARKDLGLPIDAMIFGNIGHIMPYKELEFIIESFIKFSDSQSSSKQLILFFIGNSPDNNYIKSLQENYNHNNILIINRYLSNSELVKFVSALDYSIFAFKDIWASSSMVLSLSYGVPVIVPELGCMGDYVQHLANGLIYNSNYQTDLINKFKLALNLQYYDHLQYMSNAYSEDFKVSFIADELLRIYKQVLE